MKQHAKVRNAVLAIVAAALLASAGGFGGFPAYADQSPLPAQPLVDKLVLADTIQPVTADELTRALARANSDGAHALLIVLDTPGGLLDSTRGMAGAILSSKVPVIMYVAPAGARAGSAGFFLLESADVAAMAPGTNAGAAHPVLEFGGQPDATMNQKIENDAEAFLRSYVTRRGRNTDAAVAAVQSSHSYTAEEALNQHLIDTIANNENDLMAALDGKQITRMDGEKTTLHLAGAQIRTIEPTLREQTARLAGVDPNVALLFLVARRAADLSSTSTKPRHHRPRRAGHADGAARGVCAQLAAHPLHRRAAAARGHDSACAGGQGRRPRRARGCRHRVPGV